MAERVIKSIPKTGTVSRKKVRAAVKGLRKTQGGSVPTGKVVVTKGKTASGSKKIAFRRVSLGQADW